MNDVLDRLSRATDRVTIEVEGHRLELTNLDRTVWPGSDREPITKRDFLEYLVRVSPALLPHLAERPVDIARCPQGIGGETVFGAEGCRRPRFVRTARIEAGAPLGATHLVISDLAGLLWLGEACALELFCWMARVGRLAHPDYLVVNLDWRRTVLGDEAPDDSADRLAFRRVADVAFDVRSVATALGLKAFVKTSGRRGLHCVLPIEPGRTYTEVRSMAEDIGQFLNAVRPRAYTRTMRLLARTGYVAIDHQHNALGKAIAAPYAARRHPGATVSTPLEWSELETAYPADFTVRTVPELLRTRGDPWAELRSPVEDDAPCLAATPEGLEIESAR